MINNLIRVYSGLLPATARSSPGYPQTSKSIARQTFRFITMIVVSAACRVRPARHRLRKHVRSRRNGISLRAPDKRHGGKISNHSVRQIVMAHCQRQTATSKNLGVFTGQRRNRALSNYRVRPKTYLRPLVRRRSTGITFTPEPQYSKVIQYHSRKLFRASFHRPSLHRTFSISL